MGDDVGLLGSRPCAHRKSLPHKPPQSLQPWRSACWLLTSQVQGGAERGFDQGKKSQKLKACLEGGVPSVSVDDSQPWLPRSRLPAGAEFVRWGPGTDRSSLPGAVCVRQREDFLKPPVGPRKCTWSLPRAGPWEARPSSVRKPRLVARPGESPRLPPVDRSGRV